MVQWLWEVDRAGFQLIHNAWRSEMFTPVMALLSMSGVCTTHAFPLLIASSKWRQPSVLVGLAILFGAITFLAGHAEGAGAIQLLAYLLILGAFWKLDVKIAREAFISFSIGGIAHLVIKQFVERERPSNFSWAFPMEAVYETRSFPSGHTCTAMSVAISLFILLPNRRLAWLALMWGVGVALGRVYVGVHFPIDVLAGTAIGACAAALAHLWATAWHKKREITLPARTIEA